MTGRQGWRSGAAVRARVQVIALVVPLVLAGGCGSEKGPAPGADPAKVGPQSPTGIAPVAEADTPSPQPSPTSAPAAVPSATAAVRDLQAVLTQALAAVDPAAAFNVKLDVRPSAGNQLVVEWTVSKDPDDTTAKTRLRQEAIAVLAAVQPQVSPYSSVVLIADATVRNTAGHAVGVKAVRAKYSRALIERTTFAALSVDPILALPDDKSAVVDPHFR